MSQAPTGNKPTRMMRMIAMSAIRRPARAWRPAHNGAPARATASKRFAGAVKNQRTFEAMKNMKNPVPALSRPKRRAHLRGRFRIDLDALSVDAFEQFSDLYARNAEARRDFRQWGEHESAFVHMRMGNFQVRFVDHGVAIGQNVDV